MLANFAYLIALTLISPIVAYRVLRHGRYRRGIGQKLLGLSAGRAKELTDGQSCIWVHAVSVGEVNLLPRLIHRIESEYPNERIVVSTSTDTGYDLAIKHFGIDRVFFCPLDFSWAVSRTLKQLAPTRLVLAELELWPNLIRSARKQGTRVIVVNARLSERSCQRYQKLGWLTRSIFTKLNFVACQDESCLENFAACGTPRDCMTVTGSLKFDDAPHTRDTLDVEQCARWAGIDPWHRVWVVGSSQMREEQMALQIYQSLRNQYPELRLIIVPRHQERFAESAGLITRNGLQVRRRTAERQQDATQWNDDTVMLIDTIGELRHWWGVAHIATVGGSFGDRGGQNMLEPAGYGAAVSFGPDTRNFRQIADRLIKNDAAVRVCDELELHAFVQRCLDDIPAADSLGRAAKAVVHKHRGATGRTIEAIFGSRQQAKAA